MFPMTLKRHQSLLQALPYPSSAGFPLDFPRSLGCFKTHFLATPGWKTYEQQIVQHCFLTTNVTFRHHYSHSLCSDALQSLPSWTSRLRSGAYSKFSTEMHLWPVLPNDSARACPLRMPLQPWQCEQQCLAFGFDELGRWEQTACFQLRRRACVYSMAPGEFPQIKGALSTQRRAADLRLPAAQRK